MFRIKEIRRTYNFSDKTLVQLTDKICDLAHRDLNELSAKGITMERLHALQNKRIDLDDTLNDDDWKAELSIKIADRDMASGKCETLAEKLLNIAKITFSENSARFRSFGFENFSTLSDAEKIKAYKRICRRAHNNMATLSGAGFTDNMLKEFDQANHAYDNAIDALEDFTADSDIAIEDRRKMGNEIFEEINRICKTANKFFSQKNDNRATDYLVNAQGLTANSLMALNPA